MNEENSSSWHDISYLERAKNAQFLALFPALTVMVFCRYKIGYRVVKPITLYVMAMILIVGSIFLPIGNKPAVMVYAVVMVATGLYHRHARWMGIARREKRHTLSTGDSYLGWLKLPAFFRRERRTERFLEPLAIFLVAGVTWLIGIRGLGMWLLFAGTAVMIWEQSFYDRMLNQILDLYDGALNAEIQQMIVRDFERQPKAVKQALDEIGYPAGIGADIYSRVQDLVKKQRDAAASLTIQASSKLA